MAEKYSTRLLDQLAAHKKARWPEAPDGTWRHQRIDKPYGHILPKERYQANILPTIERDFWQWFERQQPTLKLHQFFHHLNSSQAMSFNLLFPFLRDGIVDKRLLRIVGIDDEAAFRGCFEKVLHPEENTNFDFYMESAVGRKIFFEVKLSEEGFGSCRNDEQHQRKLEQQYRPYLQDHVDSKWLEPAAFCANYQVLRNLSYLGRYSDGGVVFIFPKANEQLMAADATIKQIVSKSLAPRVAIFYLEYLVERILEGVAGDEPLTEHYLAFREKYVCV
jgi:hypothetical protein